MNPKFLIVAFLVTALKIADRASCSPTAVLSDQDDVKADEAQTKLAIKFDAVFFDPIRDSSIEAARLRLDDVLKTRIDRIKRLCELNDPQVAKLELAGRGAIKRLIEDISAQRQSFLSENRDDLSASRFLYESSEILALRSKLRNGPFDEQSLFEKMLRNVLTVEQVNRYAIRPESAKASKRTIAEANVADLVRIAKLQKDASQVSWDFEGQRVGYLQYNKQLDVYVPISDQLIRAVGQGERILGFDFGPRSNLVVTVDATSKVTILNFSDNTQFQKSTGSNQSSIRLSPDEKSFVTAGYGTKAYLWSTATGELIREFELGPGDGGLTPEFSPDGKILAVGNRNSTTGLFDVESGKLLHTLGRRSSHGLKFDPSGTSLAVVYVDSFLVLWDVQTGKIRRSARAWANELYTVDWTPNGCMLVTGGYNSPLTFWDASDLHIVGEFDSPEWIMTPDLVLTARNCYSLARIAPPTADTLKRGPFLDRHKMIQSIIRSSLIPLRINSSSVKHKFASSIRDQGHI